MKFEFTNRTEVFQSHVKKVTNIGIPANAAMATIGFEETEAFRNYLIEEFGEGSVASYSPKIAVSIDNDGYISFEPTREEVIEFFEDHLTKFNWSAMGEDGLALALFDVRNFMNADAQIVIDDNKKLTGFTSMARINSVQLLGMQKVSLMQNIDGHITTSMLKDWNNDLNARDNQEWKFFGKNNALAVKIDTSYTTFQKNGKTYVADPQQAVRLLAIKELAALLDDLAENFDNVKYNAHDSVVVREMRGEDKGVIVSANVLKAIFGEYYSLLIFSEEFAKDHFNKENEDEDLADSFASLELAAELSDQKQKGLAKFANMALNSLSYVSDETFAANMLMAAKRGDLNVKGGGSTLLSTSFPKHAYLLIDKFTTKDANGQYTNLTPARYAGEKIQVLNNETFEDGEEITVVNGTGIEGYTSVIVKPMEFKGETPKLFVKYFDNKPHAVYDFMEYLSNSIAADKAEAEENPYALLSVDFGGAYGIYDKETASVDYLEAQDQIDKINKALADKKELVISYEKGEYAAFVQEDGELKLLCRLNCHKGKDFGPGLIKQYLHKAIIKPEEDYTGIINRKNKSKKGSVAMMIIGTVVGEYEGDIPTLDDLDSFEIEYEDEVKSAILVSKGNEGGVFGNVFGKVQFAVEDEDGNIETITSEASNVTEDLEEDSFAVMYDDEDEFSVLYDDEDGDIDEEDEDFELER